MNITIIGCGHVGRRVANAERAQGNPVVAVVRSPESEQALSADGIETMRLDLDATGSVTDLNLVGCGLYYFAPPPSTGTTDPRMRGFLNAIESHPPPQRIVYISTTGIYGNCHGRWVSEEQPPAPRADRARRRWDAEHALRKWSRESHVSIVVLRVAGIYGPGKLPLARLKQQTPVLRESDSPWSNRIHVDDLAAACFAAMHHPKAGDTYNISDGRPSTMTDYFNRVADATGLPRPPQISLAQARREFSPELLSYLAESKRIDNTRMRKELGVELKYPTIEDGLAGR